MPAIRETGVCRRKFCIPTPVDSTFYVLLRKLYRATLCKESQRAKRLSEDGADPDNEAVLQLDKGCCAGLANVATLRGRVRRGR